MRIVRLMWSDEDLIRLRGKLTCLELDELVSLFDEHYKQSHEVKVNT